MSVARKRRAKPKPSSAPGKAPAAAQAGETAGKPSGKGGRLLPLLLTAGSLAGFVISLYLTLVHYRGYVSPCYVVQGCETVQTSRFSTIGGVPVALFGTVFFTTMFYLAVGLLTRPGTRLTRVFKGLSFAGALSAIPLFLLQAIALRAYCSYCVATEVLLVLLWVGGLMLKTPASRADAAEKIAPAVTGR